MLNFVLMRIAFCRGVGLTRRGRGRGVADFSDQVAVRLGYVTEKRIDREGLESTGTKPQLDIKLDNFKIRLILVPRAAWPS